MVRKLANITVLTTTKNSELDILNLIKSLNSQKNCDFEWLIVDGGSTDRTLDIVKENCKINYRIISSKDFSIYHAMNLGIESILTEYYCVAGSDDIFSENFIEIIFEFLNGENDIILGKVLMGEKVIGPPKFARGWLNGMHGIGTSHSVGTIIKTELHKKFGTYSKLYPIVADQYFIKKCFYGGAQIKKINKIFGKYSINGFSSSNKIHYQADFFKMQLETENNWFLQLLIFN